MGRQVGFFALEPDLRDLLGYAESIGVGVLPYYRDAHPIEPARVHTLVSPPSEVFYLVPLDVPSSAVNWLLRPTEPPTYMLEAEDAPVIEVCPTEARGGALQPGRIWTGYDRTVPGRESADRVWRRLVRFLGAWPLTAPHAFRVGPKLATEVRAGERRLHTGVAELTLLG